MYLRYDHGISSGHPWRTNTTEDAEAVERNAAFSIGLFSEPVYGSGDWPELVKETLNETMLPRFTDEEKKMIKGACEVLDEGSLPSVEYRHTLRYCRLLCNRPVSQCMDICT